MKSEDSESNTNAESYHHPCIIVHGGAWSIPDYFKEPYLKGVQAAALEGYKSLMRVKYKLGFSVRFIFSFALQGYKNLIKLWYKQVFPVSFASAI